MNPATMLPDEARTLGVEAWATKWLREIAEILRSVRKDPAGLRDRIELLSSYLPTLTTVAAAYEYRADTARKDFVAERPKPEKGVSRWEADVADITREYRRVADYCNKLKEDIRDRISASQSNLASLREEMRRSLS